MRFDYLHFWLSPKQLEYIRSDYSTRVRTTTALINGREVEYTCCSETTDHGCYWDDMEYLGVGSIYRCDGVIQR